MVKFINKARKKDLAQALKKALIFIPHEIHCGTVHKGYDGSCWVVNGEIVCNCNRYELMKGIEKTLKGES